MSDNFSLAQISRKYVEKECPFCHKNLTKSAYYEHTQLRGSCVKPAVRTNGDHRRSEHFKLNGQFNESMWLIVNTNL